MTAIEPNQISDALQVRLLQLGERQNPWDAVDEVVAADVAPLTQEYGSAAVLQALEADKSDPFIAAIIVDCSGSGSHVQLSRPGHDVLRITEIYSDDEILAAALHYLQKFPSGTLGDGYWAWTALSNGWGQLERGDQLRLVTKLIEAAPDKDRALSVIAVGPARELFEEPDAANRFMEMARDNAKIARVVALM